VEPKFSKTVKNEVNNSSKSLATTSAPPLGEGEKNETKVLVGRGKRKYYGEVKTRKKNKTLKCGKKERKGFRFLSTGKTKNDISTTKKNNKEAVKRTPERKKAPQE